MPSPRSRADRLDVVLNGITGSIGLAPTLGGVGRGRNACLGEQRVADCWWPTGAAIGLLPVRSCRSTLSTQRWPSACGAVGAEEVERLILTASGGPFRGKARDELANVTVDDALAHPTWNMGPVVTINSATMMNKALEVIEAHLLFDVAAVAHRRSRPPAVGGPLHGPVRRWINHAAGQPAGHAAADCAGTCLARAGRRRRQRRATGPTLLTGISSRLTKRCSGRFGMARTAAEAGRCAPAVLNAANEECVAAFLAGRIAFLEIITTVDQALSDHLRQSGGLQQPVTIDDVLSAETWARNRAAELLEDHR